MSSWGTIDAHFSIDDPEMRAALAKELSEAVEQRDPQMPTGSEGGPNVHDLEESRAVWVEGNLRDMHDTEDSPEVLAWFVRTCTSVLYGAYYATLMWEIQGDGPRYRYEWDGRALKKIKGVLDV